MITDKLKARDLISTAIFSVLFYAVYMAVSAILWMSVVLNPFCVAVGMLPSGIVWAYMRVKVPKRFAILIQTVVLTLISFVSGSPWFIGVATFIGGAVAELICGAGKYKSFKLTTIAFAAYALAVNIGNYSLMLFARDYYFEVCVQGGFDAELANRLIDAVSGPIFLLSTVLAVICAVGGMFIGKALLKKHFVKAGMI
ncbi:MAG: MptD family putative ECF transporter S component [Oscillospiraceae bacterium]|jgi:energy-coupling factor transport system substrate-specific component|nr:MptD family putative ECF transporter S component [Oscillospiraceae bacterium]